MSIQSGIRDLLQYPFDQIISELRLLFHPFFHFCHCDLTRFCNTYDSRYELDAYNAAVRYFKVHLEGTKYSTKKLNEERTQLAGEVAEYKERLSAVQEDVKILRDVRHWLNQVLPSEQYRQTAEPGKKPSIQQAVKGRAQRIREEQAEKRQQSRTEKKQDMEL